MCRPRPASPLFPYTTLFRSAALGLAVHGGWHAAFPSRAGSMPVFAAAGMASLFAGIVRSPFTGAVLLVEMTGSYALVLPLDRKSTRLNSSHVKISYAVFCLK